MYYYAIMKKKNGNDISQNNRETAKYFKMGADNGDKIQCLSMKQCLKMELAFQKIKKKPNVCSR